MTNWSEYFYYDPTSPSGLRWVSTAYFGKGKVNVARCKDAPAGSCTSRNRWQIIVNNSSYLAHRIIWEMHHGAIQNNMSIDHINGNSLDNNINNLRLVPHKINVRNCKQRIDNKSGAVGVVYIESVDNRAGRTCISKRWVAQWSDLDHKRKSKSFSIKKCGYDEAFHLACEWRDKMISELNAQGAGYTDRHGKDK